MKKSFFYSFIFIVTTLTAFRTFAADTYYVIHTKGIVTNQTTGKPLKVGDQINTNDQIKFATLDALAIIMGANGKFTLAPSSGKKNDSEFITYVKQAILPLKSNGHLSTRAGGPENIIDLKGYFGSGKFAIIGEKLTIKLDARKYPISEKQIFTYRYIYNGAPVNKKIESNGNELLLNQKALYTINGTSIDPAKIENVDIYYYNTDSKNSTKIVSFNPHFLNEDILAKELAVQKSILQKQNLSSEQIKKELLSFIFDVYGKTDEQYFFEWIKTTDK